MNMALQTQMKATSIPTLFSTPVKNGLLQRKCPGCGTFSQDDERKDEPEKQLSLQRRSTDGIGQNAVPPVVYEVLNSPGQPLDTGTRTFMEPRFGYNFSRVRIHTDARATESAQAVHADAYTVGQNIVFGKGKYMPNVSDGQRLIAHELAHTLQQHGEIPRIPARLDTTHPRDISEQEADVTASIIMQGRHFTQPLGYSLRIARQAQDAGLPIGTSGPPAPGPATPAIGCGSFQVNMTAFVTGLEGTIEFLPDAKKCPTCKLIRLVQIVRVFEKPGQDYTWPGTEAPREKVKTAEDKKKGIKANYFVDHQAASCSAGKGCSLYYRDHWANPAASQDGSNDGITAKKASLWDRPAGDSDDIFEFETCARCADNGKYLGCVDWGFQADSSGKVTPTSPSKHSSPSATFDAAIATFNKYYKNK